MAVGAAIGNFGRLTFFSFQLSTWSPTEKENMKDVSPYTGFGSEFHRENNNVFKLPI